MCYRLRRHFTVAALTVTLTSCGYQLRGQFDLPSELDAVYVQAPQAIVDELEIFLEDGGTRVLSTGEGAKATIAVANENYSRRVLAVDPVSGKEEEFELVYTVNFAVRGAQGEVLVQPQTVKLRRDFIFDEDAVIGKSREESVLREEIRRDAAQQIVRRLGAALRQR